MQNNITGMNNSVLEDSFYYKWRRQKNYETEINTLNNKLRKMQEKLGGITAEAITRGSVQGEDKLTGLMQKPRELNTLTDHDMSSIGQTT